MSSPNGRSRIIKGVLSVSVWYLREVDRCIGEVSDRHVLRHTSDKAGSASVRRSHEQAPCLKKSDSAAARCGRRSLLSRTLAHAHKRKSIFSEQPLRPLVGHCTKHGTTEATAMPIGRGYHRASQASDALMLSEMSSNWATNRLGTKMVTLKTSRRANSRD